MQINYIKDKEINISKEDLLGAKPYVETLKEIIQKCDTPFTIGLLGGWGVGKSSIIRTIQDEFETKNSKISVFIYDAWKYSQDSFRRTFIYELKKTFNLETTKDFDAFYQDKNEEIKSKIGISKYWWVYLGVVVLSLLSINLVPIAAGKEFELSTFIISIFISGIIYFVSQSIVQYKISITKPKTFAPEQFEEIFKETIKALTNNSQNIRKWILRKLSNQKHIDKIVIVIDNIDRCHNELAFELLLTIKNFLEYQNVVFVIPIDEKEIKKHIKCQGNDPDEFLRKIFNTTISFKNISEGDLFDFAKKLNDKYQLSLPIDVISIVSQEFSKSPRKIIQFLNILQTELLLAEKQELENRIPKNSITGNISFYTKLLIIREEWSDIYNRLKNEPHLLKLLETDLSSNKVFGDLNADQISFFRRTAHLKPNHDNPELFFNVNDTFGNIPDITNKLIESSDFEKIKEQLNNKEITFDSLVEFIDKKFEKALKRGEHRTTIVNILSLIFKISFDSDYKPEILRFLLGNGKFLGNVISYINSNEIGQIINDLDDKLLLQFVKTNQELTKKLQNTIIDNINTPEGDKQLLINFLYGFQDEPKILKRISKKTAQKLKEDKQFFQDVKSLLEKKEIIEVIFNSSDIDSFIAEVSHDIINENNRYLIKIISIYHDSKGLSNPQAEIYLKKVLEQVNSNNNANVLNFWFPILNSLIPSINSDTLLLELHNAFHQKQQHFLNQIRAEKNSEEFKSAILELVKGIQLLYIETQSQSHYDLQANWLINFYNRTELAELPLFIDELFKEIVEKNDVYTWSFSDTVYQRFSSLSDWNSKVSTANVLNMMLYKTEEDKGLNENQTHVILKDYVNLINSGHEESKIWLNEVLKNSTVNQRFDYVLNNLSVREKILIFDIIQKNRPEDYLCSVISDIFDNDDSKEFELAFDKLDDFKINKTIIKKGVKNALLDVKRESEKFYVVIAYITEHLLLDQSIHNVVAEKIKPLLVSPESDEYLFALRILDRLSISDKSKLNAISTLIDDLSSNEFKDDDLKLLESVKGKLKNYKKSTIDSENSE